MIAKLIADGVLTPAQGRALEIWLLTVGATLISAIVTALASRAMGEPISWKLVVGTFLGGTLTSIGAGINKSIRDLQAQKASAPDLGTQI